MEEKIFSSRGDDMSYANFIAHCFEAYRRETNMRGKEIAELFVKNDIFEFTVRNYEPLHIQGAKGIVWEIDNYIGGKNGNIRS